MIQHAEKEIQLGIVCVDSGQLMICDPCYIDSEWSQEEFQSTHPVYRDKLTGKLWQFSYGGPSKIEGVNSFPGTYDEPIEENLTPNRLIKEKRWVRSEEHKQTPTGKFSYDGCCKATLNNAYQLNFKMGHAGVAVAFSSGYGDGVYPVYGKLNEDGRIVEVRIVME